MKGLTTNIIATRRYGSTLAIKDEFFKRFAIIKSLGSADAQRTGSSQAECSLISSQDLNLAAFKGQKVTFRAWDGQLRQPIIVTGPDLPVSVSPQEGFLHEEAEVDTLGVDQPETKCKFK